MNWNETFTYNFPTKIRFGKAVSSELAPHLKEKGIKKPLLVSDPICVGLPFFKKILAELERAGLKPEVYSGISKNPVKSDVHKGAEFYQQTERDAVVGIGGGASLDVARAIVLKAHHAEDLFHYEDGVGDHLVTGPIPYFVTIPTTSGTGSEVGRSAIISDDKTHAKKIIFSPRLLAQIVFADPELTMELPAFVTAATGVDALTHNLEAYVAKGFHPMCEGIAVEGMKLISQGLKRATLKPDLESRSKMMIASLMGAVAFQKGLGVVHSLAHPMSTLFNTHHGLANALALPHGVRFNSQVAADKIKNIESIFGTSDLFKYFKDLNGELGLPTNLRSQGMKDSDLPQLAKLALADFCHPSNPRPVNEEQFLSLYQELL